MLQIAQQHFFFPYSTDPSRNMKRWFCRARRNFLCKRDCLVTCLRQFPQARAATVSREEHGFWSKPNILKTSTGKGNQDCKVLFWGSSSSWIGHSCFCFYFIRNPNHICSVDSLHVHWCELRSESELPAKCATIRSAIPRGCKE